MCIIKSQQDPHYLHACQPAPKYAFIYIYILICIYIYIYMCVRMYVCLCSCKPVLSSLSAASQSLDILGQSQNYAFHVFLQWTDLALTASLCDIYITFKKGINIFKYIYVYIHIYILEFHPYPLSDPYLSLFWFAWSLASLNMSTTVCTMGGSGARCFGFSSAWKVKENKAGIYHSHCIPSVTALENVMILAHRPTHTSPWLYSSQQSLGPYGIHLSFPEQLGCSIL